VFYRFNRNRALQVGISAWLVLSGLVFVEFPVCTRIVMDYLRYLFCCAVILTCWLVLCRSEMAGGRDDAAIAHALAPMAQVLAQSNEQAAIGRRNKGEAEERRLDHFLRNNPPTFKGRFDPEGAYTWVQGMERIFHAMLTSDDQKVRMATRMLAEEAEFWWTNAKGRLEVGGEVVSWTRFKTEFLKKYFLEDLRTRRKWSS